MADLATLAKEDYRPDEIFDVELRGPDGSQLFNDDETPMTIGVIGADSDEAVKARNTSANRRISAGPRAKITAESLDSDAASYLAKLTKRWNITMGGTKPECTTQAALSLYNDKALAFIREQVDAAIGERTNFLKGSPKT